MDMILRRIMNCLTIFILMLALLITFSGCDNLNCRPDGKVYKGFKGFFAGFKCSGEF